jgi:Pyruvate/2-oxoacid:ferredoxin oxidoreductase delta subunit
MEIYLSGRRKTRNPAIVPFSGINTDYFAPAERQAPPVLSPETRCGSFEEVEGAYGRDAAVQEASRCFNCGICNDCDNCRLFCPEVAIYIDGTRCINLDYCKGCGICVVECPRNAMTLEEEAS